MFGTYHIPDAEDHFGELEDDDDGFRREDEEDNLPSWEDPNINWPEETTEETIIVEDTYKQEISKVMKEFKEGVQVMKDLMQEGGLHLVQHGMTEFRILLEKMRMIVYISILISKRWIILLYKIKIGLRKWHKRNVIDRIESFRVRDIKTSTPFYSGIINYL